MWRHRCRKPFSPTCLRLFAPGVRLPTVDRMRLVQLTAAALAAGLAIIGLAPVAVAAPTPTLVAIRDAHHSGYDRVVFEFAGQLPTGNTVTAVPSVIGDRPACPSPSPATPSCASG